MRSPRKQPKKQASSPHPASYYYRPTHPQHPPFADMSDDQLRTWVQQTRAQLQRKMQRERAYLDRRAKRGTYTPTDEAYEADQILEADIIAFFDEWEQRMNETGP